MQHKMQNAIGIAAYVHSWLPPKNRYEVSLSMFYHKLFNIFCCKHECSVLGHSVIGRSTIRYHSNKCMQLLHLDENIALVLYPNGQMSLKM